MRLKVPSNSSLFRPNKFLVVRSTPTISTKRIDILRERTQKTNRSFFRENTERLQYLRHDFHDDLRERWIDFVAGVELTTFEETANLVESLRDQVEMICDILDDLLG